MASELEPCPFCSKTMMLRSALWPSEGDADAIIHADPTDFPMIGFSDGSADGSIIEKWNCSLSNEDDFPSDGSCVRCGSVPRNANGLCNTCLDEDAERLENTRTTPVAPVSPDTDGKCGELVTVAQAYVNEDGECEEIAWIEGLFPHPECIQLVTRSQAEELLAAERSEHDNTIATLTSLITDNAALTARIKELEAALDSDPDGSGLWRFWSKKSVEAHQQLRDKTKTVKALEANLASAEKALEAARPYVEDYDTRRHNTGVDETLTQIDAVLGGKPS